MHETATAADNSKREHDVIKIVAMENGSHTADLPRSNKEVRA